MVSATVAAYLDEVSFTSAPPNPKTFWSMLLADRGVN